VFERFEWLCERLAEAALVGMLALSPLEMRFPGIEPPAALVLPVGDLMPGLDPALRRLGSSIRLAMS
jgi:hypothetical protein